MNNTKQTLLSDYFQKKDWNGLAKHLVGRITSLLHAQKSSAENTPVKNNVTGVGRLIQLQAYANAKTDLLSRYNQRTGEILSELKSLDKQKQELAEGEALGSLRNTIQKN